MKILRFQTKNHPVLGDSDIDFTKDGVVSDIVLIAGINGSGKTTVLNEIFDFLSNKPRPTQKKHDTRIVFSLEEFEISALKKFNPEIEDVLAVEELATGGALNWGQVKAYNSKGEIDADFLQEDEFFELVKCVYSTVEINFGNSDISSTTAQDIDKEKAPREKSTANISKEIAQLLVDIKALDNQDAADWMDQNHGKNVEIVKQEKRIERFRKAFDFMIEGKTFQGVKNEDNKKKVYFKDAFGREIDISSLSSGEKQIVFRAGYLLKNARSLSRGVVLIDEPEISLHPSWQEKYVQFVRNIFTNAEGVMETQVIIATHSPFIVQNESITDEKIIVLGREKQNIIETEKPKFYGYTAPEPVFVPLQNEDKPLLLVEGKSDKALLTHAWSRLYKGVDMYFDIRWANEPNDGGAGMLQRHLVVLAQHAKGKVVGLFDADAKGRNEWNGTKLGKGPTDFAINKKIPSLKIYRKVGATYLPVLNGRENYWNDEPMLSMLVLEMFFSDAVLGKLNLLVPAPLRVMGQDLVQLKKDHSIEDRALANLTDTDFEKFGELFTHIRECFDQIP